MAIPIIAAIADNGRQRLADMLINGRSFIIDSFVLGNGGHDPGNPAVALTPDPTLPVLPGQFFGPKVILSKTLVSPTCPAFDCFVEQLEAIGELSNIGLIARINFSPIPLDPEVGVTFLFAVGNFPLRIKTDAEDLTMRVSIQF